MITWIVALTLPCLGLYLGSPLLFWGAVIGQTLIAIFKDHDKRPPGASGISGISSGGR